MRTVTIISVALVFGIGLFLILFMGIAEQHYKELGIALPGITENLIDLHRMHADYLLLVLAFVWLAKDKYLPGMGYRTGLAISGLVAAILLLVVVAAALFMPFVRIDGPLGAQVGG
ncbi:MAG: hypothetical protein H0X38_11660 [Planctomycetes bacterium]|nr:hypothetical protein [Planctomycetota bacterium]